MGKNKGSMIWGYNGWWVESFLYNQCVTKSNSKEAEKCREELMLYFSKKTGKSVKVIMSETEWLSWKELDKYFASAERWKSEKDLSDYLCEGRR